MFEGGAVNVDFGSSRILCQREGAKHSSWAAKNVLLQSFFCSSSSAIVICSSSSAEAHVQFDSAMALLEYFFCSKTSEIA